MQRLGRIGHGVDDHDVEGAVGGDERAGGEQDLLRVLGDHPQDRRALLGPQLRGRLFEADAFFCGERLGRRGLLGGFNRLQRLVIGSVFQLQLDEETQQHQQHGNQERDPPAPGGEVLLGHDFAHDQEDQVRQDHPGRHAHLGEAAEEAATVRRRALDGHQGRAAPLTADREALGETQQDQDQGRSDPQGRIAGQQADAGRRQAHDHHRDHQRALAPDAVAIVAEDDAADRSRHEADRHRRERCDQRHEGRHVLGEEERREDQRRGGPVDEEVVPLDARGRERGHDRGEDVGLRGRRGGGGGHLRLPEKAQSHPALASGLAQPTEQGEPLSSPARRLQHSRRPQARAPWPSLASVARRPVSSAMWSKSASKAPRPWVRPRSSAIRPWRSDCGR